MAGNLVHIEIPASDTAKARAFWGGLFGWEFGEYGEGSDYHMAQIDERSGVAISGGDPTLSAPRTYFDVDDIRASTARVKELGGEADDAMPVPSMGWFATCRDVHGNAFGLWQTDPSAPQSAA
jgi:predicted enzyme related to lactoylglutathione lyase